MDKRFNFLLFMPETLRADAIGCLGNNIVKTPFIDQLASEGVAFSKAFVQHTVCSPSRCSIFTGWYPHTNGHRTLTYLLRPYENSLFRDLKEAGYYVQVFGKNDLLSQDSIPLHFDSVDLLVKPEVGGFPFQIPWPEDHKYYKSFYYGEIPKEFTKDFDWACIESACKFLENPPKEPFCLFLPLAMVHPPYRVEEPYFCMYDPEDIEDPILINYSDKRMFMELYHRVHGIDKLDMRDLKKIKATYYGMVSKLDSMFGRVMEKLKETGHYNDTVIVFFSDHGDYTGDYGLVEKWWTGFQDCLINVPLIIRIPDMITKGRIIDTLVEMIDLYPTILELAGINPKHTHFGKSLISLIKGQVNKIREEVFAEGGHNPDEEHCFEPILKGIYYEKTMLPRNYGPKVFAKSVMVRTEDFKYIYCPDDIDELYDLRRDPKETINIANDPLAKAIITQLKERILKWLLHTADTVPFDWDKRGWS